jgi:hypothetical protein
MGENGRKLQEIVIKTSVYSFISSSMKELNGNESGAKKDFGLKK